MSLSTSFRTIRYFIPLALSTLLLVGLSAQESGAVPTRDQVAAADSWDLTALYQSDADWETAFAAAGSFVDMFERYEGQLGKSAGQLVGCLQLGDEIGIKLGMLYSYAAKLRDQDMGNTENQARVQRISGLYSKISAATAFVDPEILSINGKKLKKFLAKNADLRLYEFYISDLRRMKDHILPKEQEELLALAGEALGSSARTFSMLTNTDFSWGIIQDEDGNDVTMSRGRYGKYMNSGDRRVREAAYKALYVPFKAHLNTNMAMYTGQLKTDVFYSKARKYENSLESAMDGPGIPTSVYHNLVNTVNANLEPLQRWAGIKKRVLELDELHPYDTYAPLFPDFEKTYTYAEAQELILAAFAPLGDKVITIVQRAFDEQWIDVYENQGKRGGAYSSGTYGVHPYILLNFDGTLRAVFVLAHELGHSIHSYLSNENQPYVYAGYATFNAEVASTTNESLLRNYLLAHAESDAERLALLQEYIQNIGMTFYRQTRFAEFELQMHRMVENDEPLTHEEVGRIFGEMYAKYWGPDMVVDEEEYYSWSRIPHFYYDYYVYTYATSFAAAQMVGKRIRDEGQPAVDDYLKFLSSGGSDYPVELLKIAGVDMSTPAPIQATAETMNDLLDQLEELLAKR